MSSPLFLLSSSSPPPPPALHRDYYTALIEAMHNEGGESQPQGCGKLFTTKARTETELAAALRASCNRPDHLCFIEVSSRRW